MPALPHGTRPNRTLPNGALPALPDGTGPHLTYPALSDHTTPFHIERNRAITILSCVTKFDISLAHLAKPCHTCVARPHSTATYTNVPCLRCLPHLTTPGRSTHYLRYRTLPKHSPPYQALPIPTMPALPYGTAPCRIEPCLRYRADELSSPVQTTPNPYPHCSETQGVPLQCPPVAQPESTDC